MFLITVWILFRSSYQASPAYPWHQSLVHQMECPAGPIQLAWKGKGEGNHSEATPTIHYDVVINFLDCKLTWWCHLHSRRLLWPCSQHSQQFLPWSALSSQPAHNNTIQRSLSTLSSSRPIPFLATDHLLISTFLQRTVPTAVGCFRGSGLGAHGSYSSSRHSNQAFTCFVITKI